MEPDEQFCNVYRKIEAVANNPRIKYFECINTLCVKLDIWLLIDYREFDFDIYDIKEVNIIENKDKNCYLNVVIHSNRKPRKLYIDLQCKNYRKESICVVNDSNKKFVYYIDGNPSIECENKYTYLKIGRYSKEWYSYFDENLNIVLTIKYGFYFMLLPAFIKPLKHFVIVNDCCIIEDFESYNDGIIQLKSSNKIYYLTNKFTLLEYETGWLKGLCNLDKYLCSHIFAGNRVIIDNKLYITNYEVFLEKKNNALFVNNIYCYNGIYFKSKINHKVLLEYEDIYPINLREPMHTKSAIRSAEPDD